MGGTDERHHDPVAFGRCRPAKRCKDVADGLWTSWLKFGKPICRSMDFKLPDPLLGVESHPSRLTKRGNTFSRPMTVALSAPG